MIKAEMLQIQQYLNVHPVMEKNDSLKKKYVSLIYYFVNQYEKKIYGVNNYLNFIAIRLLEKVLKPKKKRLKL